MPYKDKNKQKEAQARYFQENKNAIRKSQDAQRNLMRRKSKQIKENTPCKDCGINYPAYIMDFDHVFGVKKFNIASPGNCPSMKAFEEEIAKCEVVCANCHRHRTHGK